MQFRAAILNINFDTDSEPEEKVEAQYESVTSYKKNLSKFDSNALTRGIFDQQEEEEYQMAIVVPCDSAFAQSRPQENIEQEINQLARPVHSIKLLQEIDFGSEEQLPQQTEGVENEAQQKPQLDHSQKEQLDHSQKEQLDHSQKEQWDHSQKEQLDHFQKEQWDHPQQVASISSNILNIDYSQSSSSSEENRQSSSESDEELKRLLSLKFNQLKAVELPQITFSHIKEENMKIYSTKVVQIGKILNVQIYRDQSGFNTIWPEYTLFLQGCKMLVAKKMMASSTSNFYITLQNGIEDAKHEYFMGKLRSNFGGNLYQIYTKGANPKKATSNQKVRQIEATIVFIPQQKVSEPRQFEVFALALNHTYGQLAGRLPGEEVGLDVLYKMEENKGKIFHFKNRKPVYSEAVQGYILNFGGRVQKASVKNFILQDSIAEREVLMMGKTEEDIFRIDVSWPMKPYVAFCVCLANFDSKFITV